MTNFQVSEPDFDHVLSLGSLPPWLPHLKLLAGVNVSFGIDSRPSGGLVYCADPLPPGKNSVRYQGQGPWLEIDVRKTWWFSTEVINSHNPCAVRAAPTRKPSAKRHSMSHDDA